MPETVANAEQANVVGVPAEAAASSPAELAKVAPPAADKARAEASTEIQWASLGRWALKHSAIAMSPVVFLYLPFWISTKFLRLDESFTAAEFWDHCSRGDKSLEDPHYPLFREFYILPMYFGFLPLYWLIPHEGMPEVSAQQDPAVYKEGCSRAGKLWSRQVFGVLFACCWLACFFLGISRIVSFDGAILINTILMGAALICLASGVSVTGAKLGAPWIRSCCAKLQSPVLFVLFLLVAQMFTIYTPTVLHHHGDRGFVILMLVANAVIALAKQVCMRANGDLGILSVMIMGVGAAVSFFLRLFVFVKPTMGEAIVTSLMSAGVTLGGHVLNYFVFKHTKVHPRAPLTHATVLYSDEIYKMFAQLTSVLVVLAADTRYFAVAQYGFGEQVNVALVLFNFCFSVVCQLVVAGLGIKLSHMAHNGVNLEKFAASYKGFHAMLSMASLLCATVYLSIRIRRACLVCIEADNGLAYNCFD
jgi:hypothetical protein